MSVCIILFQLSCSDASMEMIPGKYCFNNGRKDSIFVYNDGTYKQKYISQNGKIFYNRGNWNFNVTRIVFHEFTFFNDEGASGGPGVWDAMVRLADKKEVRFFYSYEDNVYYYKREK